MRNGWGPVGALAGAIALAAAAAPARAVDVDLSVSSGLHGPLCGGVIGSGVVHCNAFGLSVGEQVTVTWSLASPQTLNGYDLTVAWDPEELTLVSCTALYPDTEAPGTVPFLESPCDAADPAGSDAVALSLVGFETTALFQMTFQVTSIVLCDTDGTADLYWTPHGNGLSPAGVVLGNPAGAGFDLGVVLAQCNDGFDNDSDGLIDFDGGACAGVPLAQQTLPDPQCTVPTKNKERKGCGLGFEVGLLLAPLARYRGRRRA